MSNLISREEAIKAIISESLKDGAYGYLDAYSIVDLLKNLPTKEPERETGEWIVTSEFEDCRYAKCNQCKVTQVFYYNKLLTNFCPNCGADMRGEQNGQ